MYHKFPRKIFNCFKKNNFFFPIYFVVLFPFRRELKKKKHATHATESVLIKKNSIKG